MRTKEPIPGKARPPKKPLRIAEQADRKVMGRILPARPREGGPIVPHRSPGWEPRRHFVGPLSIRLGVPTEIPLERPALLRIASVHRPPKAGWMHFEKEKDISSMKEAHVFDEIPAGEYVVAVQLPLHRPHAEIIRHDEPAQMHALSFPVIRADSPEEERDLLRPGERHPFNEGMRRYLAHYGYLRDVVCRCPADELCPHMSAALQHFQQTYRLEARGTLTLESFFLGLVPRCHVPDVRPADPLASSAGPTGTDSSDPIVFMGSRWDTRDLRYLLQTGTGDISNEWDIVRGAMNTWRDSSPLAFAQTSSSASSHLEYTFRRPGEADYPFDEGGSKHSNTLAHAWGPLNGTVEFDDHEDWGDTSLAAVATHEIGHALGLAHCGVKDATMYPWYGTGQASLHEVDVRGIKSLYSWEVQSSGPFVAVPLFGLNQMGGTDSVTIDLGSMRRFLAWGSITMVDSMADLDRDNMYCIDVYEVDGVRTGTRIYGGAHFGSNRSPANVFEGARAGYGRRITFRLSAGHVADLEVAGYAMVLVLT